MVKIQSGKRYVRRDGVISGVIENNNDIDSLYVRNYPFYDPKHDATYTDDGFRVSSCTSETDLIKEYKEPKMRKQPKKLPEKNKSLIIEDGKFYKNDNGAILGPMKYSVEEDKYVCVTTGSMFMPDGSCCHLPYTMNSLNLVEEHRPPLGDMPPGTIMLSDDGTELAVKCIHDGCVKVYFSTSDKEFKTPYNKIGLGETNSFTGTVIGTMKQ